MTETINFRTYLLSYSPLPEDVGTEIYKIKILPVDLYGRET
jgi:hypothetical protein